MDCSPPGSSVHGILGKNTGLGCPFLLHGIFPNPGIEPGSPTLQADFLSPKLPGQLLLKEERRKQYILDQNEKGGE